MAGTIATAYIQIEPSTRGMSAKLNGEMQKAGESGGKSFSSGFSNVIGGFGKVAASAIAVGGAAVGNLVKQSVSAYGEFEQLVGGVETLFGASYSSAEEYAEKTGSSLEFAQEAWSDYQDRQQTVLDNASNAYKTSGMSANEYMETVTGFAASLNASLGEYQWQSANYAEMIMTDMSDNANKMGTDIESIKNAYAGFAKGNFTMLDNLKLGYGGTKQEMERLLADAEKLGGLDKGMFDINSFADIAEAINIVQEELGIAGTTAREASTTIQGSAQMMSASWQNLIAGMGTNGADVNGLIETFIGSVETWLGNLMPVVETALTGISTLVADLAPIIAEKLPALFTAVLPQLLNAGMQVIQALTNGIIQSLPVLLPAVIDIVRQIGAFLIENLPMLIEAGLQIIMELAESISQALPELIPAIVNVVIMIAEYLIENIDLLIDASIALITGLANGLVSAMPIIAEKVPTIILNLVDAIINNAPKMLTAALKIVITLADGLIKYWATLISKIPELVNKIVEKFNTFKENWKSIGKNLVDGIWQGLKSSWEQLVTDAKNLASGLLDALKDLLGIHSPSRVFADEIGRWIPAGIAQGVRNGMSVLNKEMDNLALDTISGSIGIESDIINSSYQPSGTAETNNELSSLVNMLSQLVPQLAQGNNVNITLEGDAGRLFKLMQREQRRNTELVGV